MIFGSLFKKGTMQAASDGSIVLLNEDNVPYPVDKSDVAVWNQCTGVTFEQLCDLVALKLGWRVPQDVLSHLERYVNWCIYAKLIEVRNFLPDKFASLRQEQSPDFSEFKKLFEAPNRFKPDGG
jgi:hypothetical protein